MMDIASIVLLAGALVFAAHFFAWLFSFTAIPDALLLIVVGIVLGPVFGVLAPEFFGEFASVALTIALVVMLFEGGVALRIEGLRQALGGTTRLAVTSFILATLGVGSLLYIFTDLPFLVALIVGAIVGDTTPSLVIALLKRLSIDTKAEMTLVLESTFSDVLAVVVVIALLGVYQTGDFVASTVIWSAMGSIGLATAIGLVVGFVWAHLLGRIRHLQNSMFTTPAAAFVLYGVAEAFELSGLICVLAFGLMMGSAGSFNEYLSTKHRLAHVFFHPLSLSRREKDFFAEIVFLLQTFFFVYLGLSLQFANAFVMGLALLATGVLLLLRAVAVRASLPRSMGIREASLLSVMVPKGITSVVLVLVLIDASIPNALFIQDFVYALIFWSMLFTSLFVFLIEKTVFGRAYSYFMKGFGTESLPGIGRTL